VLLPNDSSAINKAIIITTFVYFTSNGSPAHKMGIVKEQWLWQIEVFLYKESRMLTQVQ